MINLHSIDHSQVVLVCMDPNARTALRITGREGGAELAIRRVNENGDSTSLPAGQRFPTNDTVVVEGRFAVEKQSGTSISYAWVTFTQPAVGA